MPQDNLRDFYTYLTTSKKVELPPYDVFKNDMQDERKLSAFYSNITSRGIEVPEYGTFKSDMGFSKNTTTTTQKQSSGNSGIEPLVNPFEQNQQQIPPDKTNAYTPDTDPLVQGAVDAAYSIPSKVPLRPTGIEPKREEDLRSFQSNKFQQQIINPQTYDVNTTQQDGGVTQIPKFQDIPAGTKLRLPTDKELQSFVDKRDYPKIKAVAKDYQDIDPQKSNIMYEKAIEIDPYDPDNFVNLAYNKTLEDKPQEALQNANTAIALFKSKQTETGVDAVMNPTAYQVQSWALNKLGDFDGSIQAGKENLNWISNKKEGDYSHQKDENNYFSAGYTYSLMANSASKKGDVVQMDLYNKKSNEMNNVGNGILVAKDNEFYRQYFASDKFQDDFAMFMFSPTIEAVEGVGTGIKATVESGVKTMQGGDKIGTNAIKTISNAVGTVFSGAMAVSPQMAYAFKAAQIAGENYAPKVYQAFMQPVTSIVQPLIDRGIIGEQSEAVKELIGAGDIIGMMFFLHKAGKIAKTINEGKSVFAQKEAIADAELTKKIISNQKPTESEIKQIEDVMDNITDKEVEQATNMVINIAKEKAIVKNQSKGVRMDAIAELVNVNSTTKTLIDIDPTNAEFKLLTDEIPNRKFKFDESSEKVVAEQYHKDKAKGKETKLVKELESLVDRKITEKQSETGEFVGKPKEEVVIEQPKAEEVITPIEESKITPQENAPIEIKAEPKAEVVQDVLPQEVVKPQEIEPIKAVEVIEAKVEPAPEVKAEVKVEPIKEKVEVKTKPIAKKPEQRIVNQIKKERTTKKVADVTVLKADKERVVRELSEIEKTVIESLPENEKGYIKESGIDEFLKRNRIKVESEVIKTLTDKGFNIDSDGKVTIKTPNGEFMFDVNNVHDIQKAVKSNYPTGTESNTVRISGSGAKQNPYVREFDASGRYKTQQEVLKYLDDAISMHESNIAEAKRLKNTKIIEVFQKEIDGLKKARDIANNTDYEHLEIRRFISKELKDNAILKEVDNADKVEFAKKLIETNLVDYPINKIKDVSVFEKAMDIAIELKESKKTIDLKLAEETQDLVKNEISLKDKFGKKSGEGYRLPKNKNEEWDFKRLKDKYDDNRKTIDAINENKDLIEQAIKNDPYEYRKTEVEVKPTRDAQVIIDEAKTVTSKAEIAKTKEQVAKSVENIDNLVSEINDKISEPIADTLPKVVEEKPTGRVRFEWLGEMYEGVEKARKDGKVEIKGDDGTNYFIVPEKVSEIKPIKESFKAVADKIREGKIDNDIAMVGIPLAKEVWNGAIEVVAKSVELTGDLVQGLADGIDYLKGTDWYKNADAESQKKAEGRIESFVNTNKQPKLDLFDGSATLVEKTAQEVQSSFDKQRAVIKSKQKTAWEKIKRGLVKGFVDIHGAAKKELREAGFLEAVRRKALESGSSAAAKIKVDEYFNKIYKGLKPKEKQLLDDVIQARRDISIDERFDRDGRPRPMHLGGNTKESYQAYLKDIENNNPELYKKINNKADIYFEAYREMLDLKLSEGRISKEIYDALINNEYSPRKALSHLMDAETISSGIHDSSVGKFDIKNIKEGTEGEYFNDSRWLLETSTLQTYRTIFKNRTDKALYDFAEKTPDNGIIRVQKSKGISKETGQLRYDEAPTGWTQIQFFDEGVKRSMLMENEVARDWIDNSTITKYTVPNAIRMMTGGSILRSMATGMNPVFALSNIPKDFLHSLFATEVYSTVLPKAIGQLGKDIFSVSKDVFKRKGRYLEYIDEGGGMDLLTHQGKVIETGVVGRNKFKRGTDNFQHIIGYLNETSELIVRIAVRDRQIKNLTEKFTKENGRVPNEKELRTIKEMSTSEARDQMNFSRGGNITKYVDSYIPYTNASFQGFNSFVRAAKRNPKAFSAKVAQIGAVSTALYLYNSQYDEWDDISPDIKARNFVIMLPFTSTDDNGKQKRQYVTIPKALELSAITQLFDNAAQLTTTGKMDTDVTMKSLKTSIPTINPFDVPALNAAWTYIANYDRFKNEKIWKGQQVLPEDEYTKNTSELFKNIGSAFGVSPSRLETATGKVITDPKYNIYSIMVGKAYNSIKESLNSDEERKELDKTFSEHMGDVFKPFQNKYLRESNPYYQEFKDKGSRKSFIKRLMEDRENPSVKKTEEQKKDAILRKRMVEEDVKKAAEEFGIEYVKPKSEQDKGTHKKSSGFKSSFGGTGKKKFKTQF